MKAFLVALVLALIGCGTPSEQRARGDNSSERKFASYDTADLMLRRNQIVQALGGDSGQQINVKVGSGLGMIGDNDGRREELLEEKEKIEGEPGNEPIPQKMRLLQQ